MTTQTRLLSKSTLAVVKRVLEAFCTHTTMDNLFEEHGFDPGSGLAGANKLQKAGAYLDFVDWRTPDSVQRLLRLLSALFTERDLASRRFIEASPAWQQTIASLAREGYEWNGREFVPATATALVAASESITAMEVQTVTAEVERLLASVATDPADAVTSARALIEAACRAVLSTHRVEVAADMSLPSLVKQVTPLLELLPSSTNSSPKGREALDRMLKGIAMAVQGLGELRNEYGDAHGRNPQHVGLEPRHARLAAGLSAAVSLFLMES